jgi:glutathione-independent formaldehyde dehydrogenase
MKAVSYEGVHQVAVKDHPKPKLQKPTDAVLRVTTSGICGSDLHMYDGRTPLKSGTVVGHGSWASSMKSEKQYKA